ncbi:MAG: arylsulfatase, partial [Candidatus Binatus sp.]
PALMGGRTSVTLYPGMTAMLENATLDVKNRSHTITADIEVPQNGAADGAIIAQGGRFGGWTLYMKGGKLKYCYNWLDKERYTIESKDPLPVGKATVKLDFKYDGGGVGKGGTGTLYVNDQQVGQGRIDKTQAFIFSGDETEDVGEDLGTPVTEDYKEGDNKFTGTIDKITLAVTPPPAEVERKEESQDAVIDEGMN